MEHRRRTGEGGIALQRTTHPFDLPWCPDAYNLSLSQQRAEAVRVYLMGRGVEAQRLYAIGYGETQPADPSRGNKTSADKANNRRVVFYIEQRAE